VGASFAAPFRLEGRVVRMTTSVGLATHEGPHGRADQLLRAGAEAMYRAKPRGRHRDARAEAPEPAAPRPEVPGPEVPGLGAPGTGVPGPGVPGPGVPDVRVPQDGSLAPGGGGGSAVSLAAGRGPAAASGHGAAAAR